MGKHCKGRKWSDLGDFQMLVVVKILMQERGQSRTAATLKTDILTSYSYYGPGTWKSEKEI